LIVLGVDENKGFSPVRLPDPAKLRNDLVSAATDQLEPPIRPIEELVEVDGAVLVVAQIAAMPSDQRPCYVKSRGIATGSFVRTGEGDRRMTQAEIGLAIANRGQPRYDVEPVPEAHLEDLDGAALARTLARVRDTSRSLRELRQSGLGRPIFRNFPNRFEVEFSRSAIIEWADPPGTTRDIVATELRRLGQANAAQLATVVGRSRAAVLTALRALIADGVVEAQGGPKSLQRAYRWVGTNSL
jgi:predicted HTH transcriptional regulator